MYDIQNGCIPDEIDLFYFTTCILTHNINVIEQSIDVSMFDILSAKKTHICPEMHLTLHLGTSYKKDLFVVFI